MTNRAVLSLGLVALMLAVTVVPGIDAQGNEYESGENATPIFGIAFWSSAADPNHKITSLEVPVDESRTVYFCSPDIDQDGWVDTSSSGNLDPITYDFSITNITFDYIPSGSSTSYHYMVSRVTITCEYVPTSVASRDINLATTNNANWLGTNYRADLNIHVDYPYVNMYVVASPTAGGTVSPTSFYERSLTVVTMTATANEGYTFSYWKHARGGDTYTTRTITQHVLADDTWTAVFVEDAPECVTVTAHADTGGSVDPEDMTVESGEQVTFIASANNGYEFFRWEDSNGHSIGTNRTYTANPTEDYDIYAKFNKLEYGFWSTTQDISGKITSTQSLAVGQTYNFYYLAPDMSSKGSYTRSDWFDDHFSVTSTHVSGWYEYEGTDYGIDRYTITTVATTPGAWIEANDGSGDYAARINFNITSAPTYTVTASVTPSGSGTVAPTTTTIAQGQTATFTATASSGYYFAGWYLNGSLVSSDNPYTFTPTASVALVAQFGAASGYTVTFNGNGGTPSVSSMVTDATGKLTSLPTATRTDYIFDGWWTSASGGSSITTSTVFAEDTTVYAHWRETPSGAVMWDNGYQNGRIQIVFDWTGNPGNDSIMDMGLYNVPIMSERVTPADFVFSGYTLHVELLSGNVYHSIKTTVYNSSDNPVYTSTKTIGKWTTYLVDIDAINGRLGVAGISKLANTTSLDMTNFEMYDIVNMADWSHITKFDSIPMIIHSSSETSSSSARFSVYHTDTFLDTYGVVLNNPTLNIYSYYPSFDKVRLNLYSFAIYGESMTVNGHTMELDGASVTIPYIVEADKGFTWSDSAQNTKTMDLTNVYVSYEYNSSTHLGKCWLTFVNDGFTVYMGTFGRDSGGMADMTISFEGIWYFTTGLYEGKLGTEAVYHFDWKMNMSATGLLILFLGFEVLLFLAFKIGVGREMGLIDYAVMGAAAVLAFFLMG